MRNVSCVWNGWEIHLLCVIVKDNAALIVILFACGRSNGLCYKDDNQSSLNWDHLESARVFHLPSDQCLETWGCLGSVVSVSWFRSDPYCRCSSWLFKAVVSCSPGAQEVPTPVMSWNHWTVAEKVQFVCALVSYSFNYVGFYSLLETGGQNCWGQWAGMSFSCASFNNSHFQ